MGCGTCIKVHNPDKQRGSGQQKLERNVQANIPISKAERELNNPPVESPQKYNKPSSKASCNSTDSKLPSMVPESKKTTTEREIKESASVSLSEERYNKTESEVNCELVNLEFNYLSKYFDFHKKELYKIILKPFIRETERIKENWSRLSEKYSDDKTLILEILKLKARNWYAEIVSHVS